MSLTSVDSLSRQEVIALLDMAAGYARNPVGNDLAGKIILNLFFEDSTRTLASFEFAAKRLGGAVVTLPLAQSSMKKGESLEDTAKTLNAMRPDCVVVRHAENGAADLFDNWFDCPIINAGDGTNQHPTQALLDLFTLWQKWGDVSGRKIVICGDVQRSRVARSSAKLFTIMGAEIVICAPAQPDNNFVSGFNFTTDLDAALADADAIMMLRIQKERTLAGDTAQAQKALESYMLNPQRLALAKRDALVMHPGPLNRGVEITHSVADAPQSVILNQVANGVPIRQAVLKTYVT